MKFFWLVGIAMIGEMSAAQASECNLTVNVRDTGGPEGMAQRREILEGAEALAGKMFQGVAIDINWRNGAGRSKTPAHSCGAAILLSVDASADGAPASKSAFAYAMPFETSGTLIHLFMDRISGSNGRALTTILLAHVMVHEITHVLEKTGEHSEEGVMKARWGHSDIEHMKCHPLPFAQKDIDLIHLGLARYSQTATAE
jgi:hypothetical protein